MTDCGKNGQPAGTPRYSRLTAAQCQRLHDASLEILERTGVRLFECEALALVQKAGVKVSEGNRVRIPGRLVEQALATAPERVVLYDRDGRPVMPLAGDCAYYGPGSDCLNIVDHRTGQRRRALLQDVAEGITVCDALDHVDFVMSMFLPADVDPALADRHQMEVMLNRTTKPIVFVTYDLPGCTDAVEMAEAVAGGPWELCEKPFIAGYINVTTGLLHNQEALQKLLYLAERGLPALYIPVVSSGVTAPMTMAGSMAMVNAGSLVGLVLSQLKRPGAPVILPGFGGDALDMRTLVDPYCGPEPRGMAEALAQFYRLPMFSLAGTSDAKVVDQQAALEAALTLLLDSLAGGHLVHDLGYLESGLSSSLAQLVICNEIVAWIKPALREIAIDAETLALDLIDQVGPDGSYLECEHTLRHFRDRWYPRLLERGNYDDWLAKGGKTLAERAAERVDEILLVHEPEPLPATVAGQLRDIVARAATRVQ